MRKHSGPHSPIAERGLLLEAQVLEILAELMATSPRPVIPVANVALSSPRYGEDRCHKGRARALMYRARKCHNNNVVLVASE
jgi:hypothetical protein